ncbi:MAG: SDR family oxidoreductase [Candidatus Omnitrophica bacterium]|nr:SDR family oxidoreductase [Candidatus Omnitrophota bacterium]
MTKTVLITGGAGFIGSHLCELFLGNKNSPGLNMPHAICTGRGWNRNKRYKVICIDNLITGKLSNISHLLKDKNFRFIKHNVSEYIDIKGPVDYILHFASPASPIDYLKFPIQTLKVGSLGTHNVLGLAKAKRARILLASTSEVYGDPLVNPQPESYWGNVNPIGPRGCYDEAKRFSEAITMAYHRAHKVDTKIVRIFNTYGERMREQDGRAIPNFISQALNNKPITVYGNGSQTRSFCYVSDLVDGIHRLLMSTEHDPVNIGNPSEMTLLQLARVIIKLTDSKSKIVFKPLPTDDPKVRRPNISRAKKLLKWHPKVDLQTGLTRTIEYFRTGRG